MKPLNVLFSLLAIVIFFSCKDSDRDKDLTTNSSSDYASGQSLVYNIFSLVDQAAYSSKGITSINLIDTNSIFGCDTLIVDTISNPKSITIRFNNGCTNRNGEIKATFSSKYDIAGCNINISFNNFSQDDLSITSDNISIINNGIVNTHPNYSFNVNELVIENSNGQNINWSGNQEMAIVSGDTTASFSDNTYSIEGIANGKTYKGNNFNATITSNLTYLSNCQWVSSGIVNINPENKDVRTLNFGSDCDNTANVSIFDINNTIIF